MLRYAIDDRQLRRADHCICYGIAVYFSPMHTVVTTSVFERQAKEAGLSDDEMAGIIAFWRVIPTLA